jgi:hypothetical protein
MLKTDDRLACKAAELVRQAQAVTQHPKAPSAPQYSQLGSCAGPGSTCKQLSGEQSVVNDVRRNTLVARPGCPCGYWALAAGICNVTVSAPVRAPRRLDPPSHIDWMHSTHVRIVMYLDLECSYANGFSCLLSNFFCHSLACSDRLVRSMWLSCALLRIH